ncbi:unnamed protein product [Spodoptera littoralis]|uniref:Reverse transcriptase domain-containing protein n=1 Tax=Spodoptera littoralis TaxID=7109 RepID=A0A9P0I5N3_SPOLI|nr:unnamed protein product [Spodoptera littoralis]CAH1640352.1 unnamed protein product [Spodoptera littoralis]
MFRLSLETGQVPVAWKLANVQPVSKKGSRTDPNNYRPISVMSLLCKIMERVLNNKLLAYIEGNDLLSDRQHGFDVTDRLDTFLRMPITSGARPSRGTGRHWQSPSISRRLLTGYGTKVLSVSFLHMDFLLILAHSFRIFLLICADG